MTEPATQDDKRCGTCVRWYGPEREKGRKLCITKDRDPFLGEMVNMKHVAENDYPGGCPGYVAK